MSHFAGLLTAASAGADANPAAGIEARRRLLNAMARNPSLVVNEVSDTRFWCAATTVPVWPAAVAQASAGVLGALAGDPVMVDGATPPNVERSVHQVFEALGQGRFAALAQAKGMFCAAVWNARAGRLVLATDALASRPLYYTQAARGGPIAFATSLRLLRVLVGADGERVDEQGFAEQLFFGQALGERTVFRDVKVLTPGQAVVFTDGSSRQSVTHADYTATPRLDLRYEQASDCLHACFAEAVRRRAIGTRQEAFLSGGMDSRAVVAELVDQGHTLSTFCAAYPDSIDDVVSRQVAQAFGITRHTTWHRTPAERILVALDPFAIYARDHFPTDSGRTARGLWSGDGGSVTLGHVYMTEASVALAATVPNADLVRRLFPTLQTRPTRQLSAPETARLAEMATAGAMAELERCSAAEPDRRLFHFYMRNDQARHLYHHYEAIDLSQIELLTPFFDADFVSLVSALPTAWFLNHRIYNDWIQGFRCGAGNHYWQPYRGHLPCPHPNPSTASDQWDNAWYSGPQVRQAYARMAGELLGRDEPLAAPYHSKGLLRLCGLLNRVGVSKYNYEIAYARNLLHTLGRPD